MADLSIDAFLQDMGTSPFGAAFSTATREAGLLQLPNAMDAATPRLPTPSARTKPSRTSVVALPPLPARTPPPSAFDLGDNAAGARESQEGRVDVGQRGRSVDRRRTVGDTTPEVGAPGAVPRLPLLQTTQSGDKMQPLLGHRSRRYREVQAVDQRLKATQRETTREALEHIIAELDQELFRVHMRVLENDAQRTQMRTGTVRHDKLPMEATRQNQLVDSDSADLGGAVLTSLELQMHRLALHRDAAKKLGRLLPAPTREELSRAIEAYDALLATTTDVGLRHTASSANDDDAAFGAAHAVVDDLQRSHAEVLRKTADVERDIAAEDALIASLKKQTTIARMSMVMSQTASQRNAQEASSERFQTGTAQHIHATNMETAMVERKIKRITQLRKNACVPLKVMAWRQDTLDAALAKLKYWQKQCELLQLDLVDLQTMEADNGEEAESDSVPQPPKNADTPTAAES